jgi:hypothetical protein
MSIGALPEIRLIISSPEFGEQTDRIVGARSRTGPDLSPTCQKEIAPQSADDGSVTILSVTMSHLRR